MSYCTKFLLDEVSPSLHLENPRLHFFTDAKDGDGWLGNITRVQLTHDEGVLNIVVKTAPNNPTFRKQILVPTIYENETYFYTLIAPHFDTRNSLFPRYYASSEREFEEVLVLEDLKTSGFEMVKKVDLCCVFEAMAEFHARSFIAKIKHEELFGRLSKDVYKGLKGFYENSGMTASIVSQCSRIERIFEKGCLRDELVLSKLRSFKERVPEVMNDYQRYHNDHSVIIHGDCWINNFMIKYEDNIPSVRLIDFQLTRLGSVVQDLSTLFYTCGDQSSFRKLDEYLLHYHTKLTKAVERSGCSIEEVFPFSVFKQQWNKFCTYGLAMTIVVLHGMLSESHEFPDVRQMIESGSNIFEALNFDSVNEGVYETRIKDVLYHFVDNDYI